MSSWSRGSLLRHHKRTQSPWAKHSESEGRVLVLTLRQQISAHPIMLSWFILNASERPIFRVGPEFCTET